MYGATEDHPHGEDVIYYLTVYNEPIVQPAEPENLDVEGLLKGIYHVADAAAGVRRRRARGCSCSPPASAFPWITEAAAAARRGLGRRRRRLVGHVVERAAPRRRRVPRSGTCCTPRSEPRVPYVTDKLEGRRRARSSRSATTCAPCQNQIATWVPGDFHALGTDGFGFADTRPAARRFFQVDAESIVVQALAGAGRARRGQARGGPGGVRPLPDRRPDRGRGVKQEGGDA